jgi:hypothetical protein
MTHHVDSGSDSEGEEEEQVTRPIHRRKRSRTLESDGSTPPEMVMRLPFTTWMNTTLKERTSYRLPILSNNTLTFN